MEVQEFVSNILTQLETSLSSATQTSVDKRFYFHNTIKFDLAVTQTTSEDASLEGGVKAGIHVVGAGVNGKSVSASAQELVQRISFDVFVVDKEVSLGVVSPMQPEDVDY